MELGLGYIWPRSNVNTIFFKFRIEFKLEFELSLFGGLFQLLFFQLQVPTSHETSVILCILFKLLCLFMLGLYFGTPCLVL